MGNDYTNPFANIVANPPAATNMGTVAPSIGAPPPVQMPTMPPQVAAAPAASSSSSGSSIFDYLPTGGTGLLGGLFSVLQSGHQKDIDNAYQTALQANMAKSSGNPLLAIHQTLTENPSFFHKVSPDILKNTMALAQAEMPQNQIVQNSGSVAQVSTDPMSGKATLKQIGQISNPLFQVSGNRVLYSPVNPDGSPMMGQDGNPLVKTSVIDPNKDTQTVDLGGVIQMFSVDANGQPQNIKTFGKTMTPDAAANLQQAQIKAMTPEDSYGLAALAAGAPAQGGLAALAYKYNIPLDPSKTGIAAQAVLDQQKVQNPLGFQQPRPGVDPGKFANSGGNNVGNMKTPGGGFRSYPDLASGIKGTIDNLSAYGKKGINTIDKIAATWAPASDGNDPVAYAKGLAQISRLPLGTPLDLTDPKVLTRLALGIANMEQGNPSLSTGGDASAAAAAQTGNLPPPKPWAKTGIVGMNYDPEKDSFEKLADPITGPGARLAGIYNQITGMFSDNNQVSPEIPYAYSRVGTLEKALQPVFANSKYFSTSEQKTMHALVAPQGNFTGPAQYKTALGALRDSMDAKLSTINNLMGDTKHTSKTEYTKLEAVRAAIMEVQQVLGPDPRPLNSPNRIPDDFQLYTPHAANAATPTPGNPLTVADSTIAAKPPDFNVNPKTNTRWYKGDTMTTAGPGPFGPAGTRIMYLGGDAGSSTSWGPYKPQGPTLSQQKAP